MKKNFTIFFLFSIGICAFLSFNVNALERAYTQTDDGIVYSINEDGEVTVEGSAGYVNKVAISDEIEGYPVRYISDSAFYNNSNITSVTISDNVISIGKEAFGNCQKLTKVKLPVGLETIEAGTFIQCGMLTDIVLPDTLKSIGDFAFEGCTRLKNVTIPASVEYIGHEAFITCESLLLDVSQNEYAAEYAAANSIETEYKSSWDYLLLQVILVTIGAILICVVVYIVLKRVIKRKRK